MKNNCRGVYYKRDNIQSQTVTLEIMLMEYWIF